MFYYIIDLLGTVAFTISGVMVAMNKRLDAFGIFIIGFVTALGGGTVRDILLGVKPVTWLINSTYMYVVIGTVLFAVFFRSKLKYLNISLFLFDTIGIGLYTVVGVEKGIAAGLHPIMCIALGTISACFGGVLRDILCNEIPVIFRKEIYATACILGGISYFVLTLFNIKSNIVFAIPIIVVILVRLLAVKYKLQLPSVYGKEE
ncbi:MULTISPECIES: trimeric intracellular cation channel family protein [Galbibacter]|uniref:Trimeric intracellular cation channel family protein n=1 Tax=Galbibacter pacificus TaxID=2996052 RepID=A0ABT6FRF8_9FLAO|nr:trimeric intracellular cation channel family protein [Galbibacter pacificus]MDG3581667.1 trimeric intracellular cation channel family protein [Galbibacter pacificus]MDG3585859.1 trimeric intracellular cation channel family protein [Galbibacter pacificus]